MDSRESEMLKTVPLLTIPVVIYNIVALAAPA